jgi:hypothetical protein
MKNKNFPKKLIIASAKGGEPICSRRKVATLEQQILFEEMTIITWLIL